MRRILPCLLSLLLLFSLISVSAADAVTVTIDGPDEETAAPVIETFFKENF